MSNVCKALSATEAGCGKKTGSFTVWFRWNCDITFGKNFGCVRRTTLCLCIKGSCIVNACISLTLLRC
ncbi:hypothetical protein NDU88_004954, partial [Pleurodeles waltl]